MSIYVMVPVFRATGFTPHEKLVALALADNAHDDGCEARPSIRTMVQKTALSERTVQRTLKALVEKGVIEIQRSSLQHSPTVYRFLLTPDGSSLACVRGAPLTPQDEPRGVTQDARGVKSDPQGCHPDTLNVINHQEPSHSPPSGECYPDSFESLWAVYPRKKEKKTAYRAVKARLRANATYAQMIEAVTNYAAAMFGTEERFIKLPATFFGPDDKWRDWLAPTTPPSSSGKTEPDPETEQRQRHEESAPPPSNFAASIRERMMRGTT